MSKPTATDPVDLLHRFRAEAENAVTELSREIEAERTEILKLQEQLRKKEELRKVKRTEVDSYHRVLEEIARGRGHFGFYR